MSAVHEFPSRVALPQPTPVPRELDAEKTLPNLPVSPAGVPLAAVHERGHDGADSVEHGGYPDGDGTPAPPSAEAETASSAGGSLIERARALAGEQVAAAGKVKTAATGKAKELFVPPDFVGKDRPSLQKIRRYGTDGGQVSPDSPLQHVSRAWSWFAQYHAARGYLRAWLMERPARGLIFIALLVLASRSPAGRAVLTVALWPAHTAIGLLTNY